RGRSDMSMDSGDANQLQRALAQSVREHWVLFLIEGIVLVVLGLMAIIIPPLATIAVTIFLGWLFLISGIVGLVTTFWARHAPGFWWSLLSAVLAIAAGIVLLGWPVRGAVSLTLLLIVFFIIEGVLSIMYAFEHKKELSGQWGWMLVSGIIDLILAAIILAGLPGTAEWALGLLVGINMLFGGTAMIAMALHARTASASPPGAQKAVKSGCTSRLAASPRLPTRAGAPRRSGLPSISKPACTETSAFGASRCAAVTRDPISGSSGCAIRQPSTSQDEKPAKPSALGSVATAAAKRAAASACGRAAPLCENVRVRRIHVPI